MADQDWTVKEMIEALTESPQMQRPITRWGPNGAGAIGNMQNVKVRGADDEMRMLPDR